MWAAIGHTDDVELHGKTLVAKTQARARRKARSVKSGPPAFRNVSFCCGGTVRGRGSSETKIPPTSLEISLADRS